jgi:hypothetical protein
MTTAVAAIQKKRASIVANGTQAASGGKTALLCQRSGMTA